MTKRKNEPDVNDCLDRFAAACRRAHGAHERQIVITGRSHLTVPDKITAYRAAAYTRDKAIAAAKAERDAELRTYERRASVAQTTAP